MMKKEADIEDYVYWISSTSQDGFGVDREWQQRMVDSGILCSICFNVKFGQLDKIDQVIVRNDHTVRTHKATIGGIQPNEVISKQLTELLGPDRVEPLGRKVPLISYRGMAYSDFVCFLRCNDSTKGIVRGCPAKGPFLCKECGQLLYWPGWPPEDWYVLRRDWPAGTELAFLGFLLCSSSLWEQVIAPQKLKQLKGYKISIVDEPKDGWPADYKAMKDAVKNKGLIK
jgi:hypothetical protein